jgi:hypothetical protein
LGADKERKSAKNEREKTRMRLIPLPLIPAYKSAGGVESRELSTLLVKRP